MDAKEYIREAKRMCKSCKDCNGCPIKASKIICCLNPSYKIEDVVDIVEKWSKEHPIITNADKFREVFGIDILASYDNPYCQLSVKRTQEWIHEEYKEPMKENTNDN